MEPKLIIVPFSGDDQELPALEYAFDLSDSYEAHIEVWHISADPASVFMPYLPNAAPAYPEKTIAELEKRNEINRKAAEQKFLTLKKERKTERASFHAAIGNMGQALSLRGRVADLIVLSRSARPSFLDEAHHMLFGSGHPVLLVPFGNKVKFNGNVLIAWNGSVEAAHAVTFSLPYLKQGKVSILTEQNTETLKLPLYPEDLAQYLRRHGVQVKILADFERKTGLSTFILESAKKAGAGMIVMGAYSHSRIRENIIGGVTKSILEGTDMPVFMAH